MKYCIIFIIIAIILLITVYYVDNFNRFTITPSTSLSHKWKGLCLFDIDGTLTTGIDNYTTIELCLQAGYAVGITTAGAMYTPNNLMSFSWMPKNLYNFMSSYGFNTFNNVASNIIMGKYDPSVYIDIRYKFDGQHIMWGLLKARSLVITASVYDITDPKKMILFDNDPGFLEGLSMYNPDLIGICAGHPCGSAMTPQIVSKIL
jgi:hypothetical protein